MASKHEFDIAKLPLRHTGKGRAGINYFRRDDAKRFEVVRISRGDGRSVLAAVIGHEKALDVIQLDLDLRTALGVEPNERLPLCIHRVGWLGTLIWYATVRDPQIRVSALLALVSLGLGVFGLIFGIVGLLR